MIAAISSLKDVLIEITYTCNLNCAQCYNGKRPKLTMQRNTFERILDTALSLTPEKIYIAGGEPFTHPDIDQIINICGSRDAEFVFATNGLLLTDELFTKIKSKGNIALQISVDGVTKDTYEAHRGAGTFDKFSNILSLANRYPGVITCARTCVSKKNLSEVEHIYVLCLKYNIVPSFVCISKQGNAVDNWGELLLTPAEKVQVGRVIEKLNKKFNLSVTSPAPAVSCNYTDDRPLNSIFIDPIGNVACCQFYCDKPLGNITQQTIQEIFEGDIFQKRYTDAKMRKNILSSSEKCTRCYLKEHCNFGCVGMAELDGDYFQTDGDCEFRKLYYATKYFDRIRRNENEKAQN